jgi:hypothetical protein
MNASVANDWKPEAVAGLTVPEARALPKSLLYATSSGLGGTGLNTTSLEGVMASVLRREECTWRSGTAGSGKGAGATGTGGAALTDGR